MYSIGVVKVGFQGEGSVCEPFPVDGSVWACRRVSSRVRLRTIFSVDGSIGVSV